MNLSVIGLVALVGWIVSLQSCALPQYETRCVKAGAPGRTYYTCGEVRIN